ncbi:MAG: DNRLRE domain-containing protein [Planctomycetota bacterium]
MFKSSLAVVVAACAPSFAQMTEIVRFRDGLGGYNGTIDTLIWEAEPDTTFGSEIDLEADASDSGLQSQILLQFTGVLAALDGVASADVQSASLRVYTNSESDDGEVRALRLLQAWGNDSTWNNSFGGNGVDADGIDAVATPSFTFMPIEDDQFYSFDVTSDVRAWVDGADNFGWAFVNDGEDGWDIDSSEFLPGFFRPQLTIEFVPTPSSVALFGLAAAAATRRRR